MYCKKCFYNLSEFGCSKKCPSCELVFDPSDEESFSAKIKVGGSFWLGLGVAIGIVCLAVWFVLANGET